MDYEVFEERFELTCQNDYGRIRQQAVPCLMTFPQPSWPVGLAKVHRRSGKLQFVCRDTGSEAGNHKWQDQRVVACHFDDQHDASQWATDNSGKQSCHADHRECGWFGHSVRKDALRNVACQQAQQSTHHEQRRKDSTRCSDGVTSNRESEPEYQHRCQPGNRALSAQCLIAEYQPSAEESRIGPTNQRENTCRNNHFDRVPLERPKCQTL